MIHKIVSLENPALRKPARIVERFGPWLKTLAYEMFETMYANNGVGLAAPQIGLGFRMAVVDVSGGKEPSARVILINPMLRVAAGVQSSEEGCLSLPGFKRTIKRPEVVSVRAMDLRAAVFDIDAIGLLACAIMHELDHLQGRLIDKWPFS